MYRLRGREPDLEAIEGALSNLVEGRGGVLILEGPPGIGKSSLLAEAVTMARRAGVRALAAEAFESQQTVPFAPLLGATLDGAPTDLALGAEAQVQYWMLHDLQGWLEDAVRHTPLVVILDDVQWLDGGTLLALRTLPGRLSGSAILWLVAARTGTIRPEVRAALARLGREGAQRRKLAALSEEAVTAIIRDRLQANADGLILELTANARGNPFLLVELLEGLREERRVHDDGRLIGTGLPHRLTDSMRERLDRLTPDAARAVRVAAVLGHRFSVAQLAAILQVRPPTLLAGVEEALGADLLVEAGDELAFRHDLLRQAVLETLPRTLRRALQREVVDVLLEHGAAPLEVAQALAESAEPGDRVAVEQLRAAARELLRSDTSAAADLNLRALELVGAGEAPPDSLIAETVLSLSVAMRGDEARALGDRALAHRMSSEEEAAVRLGLSAMLPRSMLVRAEENRRALTLEGLTPVMRARHEAWLAYNLVMSGRFAETAAIAGPALEAAQVSGDVQAIVIATVGLAGLERARGGATRSLALMNQLWALPREAADAPIFSVLDIHHADTFADLGRIDEALRLLEAGVERGRREHNQFLEAWPLYASLMRLRSGQLADARAEAESAEDVFDQAVAGNYIASIAMATLGEVAVHTGDEALLRSATHAALRVQDGTTPAIRRLGAWMLARAAAARQDWAEAVRLLADDELPYAAPSLPNDAGNAPFVTRIALAAGERDLARRAVAVAESFERASPGVVVIGACAAHARGLLDDDAAILLDAARALHGTQRPLLFAAAAEDAGRALARGRRTADAVASLEQAFDAYAEFEAAADARRVGRLLREHGVRRRVGAQRRPDSGWGSLTGSELRVARLIADGASNRDAADQLFLSPHTVSSHLRSAFSKLQINSRVELTRAVLQHDSR